MVLQVHNKNQPAALSLSGLKKIPLSMQNSLCTDDTSSNDSYGDSCSWYYDNPSSCGNYDTSSFTAATQCCACGRPNDPPAPVCTDDLSTLDAGLDSCTWYYDHQASCGSYDTEFFTAATQCCACGRPADPILELVEVCESNAPGLDRGSDDCDWYTENGDQCGNWDDDDFVASENCCACGGGLRTLVPQAVSLAATLERQPKISSTEQFMIGSLAIASVLAVAIHVRNLRKDEREVADTYQKLI